MEAVINIPQWALIMACVYISMGIIGRIIILREKVIETEWWMNRKNIKWPRWKFKWPQWMKYTWNPTSKIDGQIEAYNDLLNTRGGTGKLECKSCGGFTKILIDGLCVGCRRE